MFLKKFSDFKKCDSGAVTADWVVLSGLIVMVAFIITPVFVSELEEGGAAISEEIELAHTALSE